MTHLNDEQLEEILQGLTKVGPDDLDEASRQRLAELRAVRGRLRSAFTSVKVSNELQQRIRARMEAPPEPLSPRAKRIRLVSPRFWRRTLAVAAAILVIAIPTGLHFTTVESAGAAQAALHEIHEGNLSGGSGFHSETDPQKVVAHLREQLGYAPALPPVDRQTDFKGCCVVRFRRRSVGSYAFKTPQGTVSVVVLPDAPETLRFGKKVIVQGRIIWLCSHGTCKMAAVRIGGRSYCALGNVPQEHLKRILIQILTGCPSGTCPPNSCTCRTQVSAGAALE